MKTINALKSISEVSHILDVRPDILRQMEKDYEWVNPVRRNNSTRFYRKNDIELIYVILKLRKEQCLQKKIIQAMIVEKGKKEIIKTYLPEDFDTMIAKKMESIDIQSIDDEQTEFDFSEYSEEAIKMNAKQYHVLSDIMDELISIRTHIRHEKSSKYLKKTRS